MYITVTDDFSPEKIINSGQSFRAVQIEPGYFRFIYRNHVLHIRQETSVGFEADADRETWEKIWSPYFDFGRNYAAIRSSADPSDLFMQKAVREGTGIRILRQDPWEMLISFIISQRKSIPAIRQSIELIAGKWGTPVRTPEGTVSAFPTAEQMADASEEALKACKVGYRAPYILHAVRAVLDHKLNPDELYSLSCPELINTLMSVKGVGIKIASCIALFAYGQTSAAPVDTWIKKIIYTAYSGKNPFPGYGDAAGIMQQYAFFYALNHKEEFPSQESS